MATYYAINAGGNWNAGATWSTTATKDASRTGGSTAPTTTDDCIVDDYSGNVTINATNCVTRGLDCTGHTGTMTFTSGQLLSVYGNLTFGSGMTLSGTGTLTPRGTVSIDMGGKQFPGSILASASSTYTLLSALSVAGAIKVTTSYLIFAGAYNISCDSFIFNGYTGSIRLVSGQTLSVASSLFIASNDEAASNLVRSTTPSSATYINYAGTAANATIALTSFNDVEFNVPVDNWYGGTLTRTSNITNRTSADIGGGSGGIYMPAPRMIGV